VGCFAGAILNTKQFFISYLFGYLFWLGLALGCLEIAMLHHLTGGRWGFVIRRFLESGFRTLPIMAVLFIPVFFGLRELYPWATPQNVAADPVLQHKHGYMNGPAFIGRAIIVFGIWIIMARLLRKWSFAQDRTKDPEPTRRLRTLSGPGIVIYPLTATFAYIDWVMSMEADWYSTMFPVIIVIGQILSAFAFSVLLLSCFRGVRPISEFLSITHFHHLGNLLLTFVMFWTYISFSQFLIIWSGNLPHEIAWYLHRSRGGWLWVVITLALFHFFIPFYLLLFRKIKQSVRMLATIAGLVFFMHMVSVYWFVAPSFYPKGIHISWLDFSAPLGVGGVWVAVFISRLKQGSLVPLNDPRFEYSPAHEFG
jgi:hypothetical protein